MLSHGLSNQGPLTLALVFAAGFLTSLGPCSLSLLPVTLAYLAGFDSNQAPWLRSIAFCGGIVGSLVLLGSLSGLIGRIYGQVPGVVPTLVALLAVVMGLNLLGLLKLPLPTGPDPDLWRQRVPAPLAPVAAGLAFGLAASPCTTPVLAVLLGWIAQSGQPLVGIVLLTCFGIGQVLPLLLAGSAAAILPKLLALRPLGRWIPPMSGAVLLTTGVLTLLARWS
ncbi:Thiol:disulfide interchange protein DsbD [Prochlorococcus marinus str. MIT 1313]|uniref:cytochrome c biogenesis CcdA family protein n=1 Tax=Prochlorococcus TaxID=1218 RepID=UPI0007BBAAC6|nr:cytochrome c biogenesis protein CcdA [Prochlorococcus marinus]KZR69913.1 Thiol:disulfide interchange protein DsbD [Prochlorococcus marinus str. MIT 1313]KZR72261.1 Thiol:disulfide interchange protein DsbD [Prochlorococcus marinus str. MIT 1318]